MQYGYTKSLEEFSCALEAGRRLIGLDPGSTLIGVALSDDTRTIASPHSTVARSKWSKDAASIEAIAREYRVAGLVIGYPVNMDGSEGPRCQSVRQMAKNLAAHLALPILLWDERLSTSAVTRMMIDEGDLSRARRAQLVDKLAATYMLQGALDGLRMLAD